MTELTVAALAQLVGGRMIGDGSRRIAGLGDLRTAGPDRIGFVRAKHFQELAKDTRAGAVLTAAELSTSATQIVVRDVDVAYAKIAAHYHPVPRASSHQIHPTAVVDAGAQLDRPVVIGPRAVVGRCRIGEGTIVSAGVVIGDGVVIGRDCLFHPNTTIYANVQIGNRVIVQANAVIGGDGFGYANDGGRWLKVPQLGNVVLEDDVEIGAGTTVDRATLGSTRIGARTKIDNLCQIAHNCTIGVDVAFAAQVGVAGSTTVGDRCVFAGMVGIAGHLTIGSDVRLGGGSVVLKDIPEPGDYMGHPLMEMRPAVRLLRVLREMVHKREDGE